MPSPSLIEEHRAELADIVAVAQAQLAEAWWALPLEDADAAKAAATVVVTDLVSTYGEMAAGAGADWYSEVRREAGVRGPFAPRLAVPVVEAQIASNVGWAVSPLYGETDGQAALARLAGSVQRLTVNAERATVLTNLRRDTANPRWYRGTSGNACAFCAMTASRGAVYRSEQTGGFKSHTNCRCFAVPLFPGESHTLPSYYDDFVSEYEDAAKAVEAAGGKRTEKAVLAKWREMFGRP